MTTGTCLCGSIRYQIDAPFTAMVHCHCSMCRKHHGSQFATFAAAPRDAFRWLAGAEHVVEFASSEDGKRAFCRRCGSPAPLVFEDAQRVIVPAGCLEQDPGLRPQMHIFVGSKAPGYEISDDLPQHEAYPPALGGGDGVERAAIEAQPGVVPGSCLCGTMAWEVEGPPVMVMNCHCSRCRRARGAAHATNAFYKLPQFRWIRGEDASDAWKVPDAQYFTQHFCRTCGSPGPRVIEQFNRVMLPVGAMDADPGMRPGAHIFVESMAPWFEIGDDIPQFAGMPPRS